MIMFLSPPVSGHPAFTSRPSYQNPATVIFRPTFRYVKLILLFTQREHTYPADWVFLSPDQSVNYTCGADAPLAVDVILDVLDGRAGPHRFFAGGTEIIEAAFKADTLLGPNFEGKPHSAYLSQLIIPTFRLKAMT